MDPNLEAERRVGTTLRQKWRLEKLLGVGGMAAVYVGVHKIGRREAIKILHADVAASPELRARFEQEAHAVNRFKHPGTVEIRDIDVAEDGAPFLVMELLEGESLAERARRLNGIELDEMLRLVDELCDVLAAAHAQGIIHRDIKLDNVFVTKDGHLKVLDFGIARVRDGLSANLRTRAGAALGTAPYMAPEQIKGIDIDARVDLFAVGATMFRLVARRRIHEASTETEMLIKMANEPAPPLARVAPSAPEGVCLVVDRALEFDRDERYPDAATMQADIRALRAGLPPPYATARAREPAPARPFADAPTRRGDPVHDGGSPGQSLRAGKPALDPGSAPIPPVTGVGLELPLPQRPVDSNAATPVERRPADPLERTAAAAPVALGAASAPASSLVPTLAGPAREPAADPRTAATRNIPAMAVIEAPAHSIAVPQKTSPPQPLAPTQLAMRAFPDAAAAAPEAPAIDVVSAPPLALAVAAAAATPPAPTVVASGFGGPENTMRSVGAQGPGAVEPPPPSVNVLSVRGALAAPPSVVHPPPVYPTGPATLNRTVPAGTPFVRPRKRGGGKIVALILVGLLFVGLGVAIVLWLTQKAASGTGAGPSRGDPPEEPLEQPGLGPRGPGAVRTPPKPPQKPAGNTPPAATQPQPPQQQPQQPPSQPSGSKGGKGKGHGGKGRD